jgi:NitT/TauT family transport system permease protein
MFRNRVPRREFWLGFLVPVLVIAIWQSAGALGWLNAKILPTPLAVLTKWIQYAQPTQAFAPAPGPEAGAAAGAEAETYLEWLFSGELPHDLFASTQRVFVGFLIGGALALPLGLLMGASRTVYATFNPLIQVLRPIPPIAFIPLSILWFGLGNPPAYFLISLGAFFPILMNTISGVRNVDSIYIRAAKNLGANGFVLFRRVILPAAMPQILTGVRVGMGVAFICVIVAEMIAVNSGLGYRILEAREFFWSDKIIAGMFTIGLLGLAIDSMIDLINRRLLRWQRDIES